MLALPLNLGYSCEQMPELFKLKDHFKENQLYTSRSFAAIVFCSILLCILVARQFCLQILDHDNYMTMSRNNQIRMIPLTPTRGLIYDRNGVLLADNIPSFNLEISPSLVKDLDGLIAELSKFINISESDIKSFYKQKKFRGKFESIPIRAKLSEEEVAKFSINQYRFPGVAINANLSRHYPFGHAIAHVVGYTGILSEQDLNHIDLKEYRGTQVIGKYGVEKSFEHLLHGTGGYEQVETDARGRMVRNLDQIPSSQGDNLYLTIDSKLQTLAYDLLKEQQGAAVAIDVRTGEVLAMVSKPSFDPNQFVKGIAQEDYKRLQKSSTRPLYHRAIRGQYPPGSTVKPLVALQALDLNVITTKTRFNDPGYYQLHSEGRLYRDWLEDGHGVIGVEDAIAESCTTFFYFVADKLGIDHMHDIFQRFGLGEKTQIELDGEYAGIAPSRAWKKRTRGQNWFQGETLITGIGQGYTLVTPLQMATVASTIANRGKRLQPTIIKSTVSIDGKVSQHEPKALDPVVLKNPQHWDTIIKSMQKVITSPHGTAHWIYKANSNIEIAGKTGTVQVYGIKQDEKYDANKIKSTLRDHAWFIAFAPVENPEIAVAVVLEHTKGSPMVARKIIEGYFAEKASD